ncbi:hypothetical protein SS05631_b51660 (plasmid) [Sinorhizobium sp. CCBAU 05631]|nr:hypothetical protein SS05631_b51660 [Sinorhizobium sp. CCBAU 05631]
MPTVDYDIAGPVAATQIFHEQAGGVGPIFIQLAASDEDCLAVPL